MARSEARISVDIWAPESDFTELTADAQWMYFFLLSQPDLAHDGVIALRERRWSKKATGITPDDILKRLNELEHARYVVADYDAEELLVRSFVRRDKVYRQPNVLRSAADHLPMVSSEIIRATIAVELRRVQSLDMPQGSAAIITEMLEGIGEPFPEPIANPCGNPSAKGSEDVANPDATDSLGGTKRRGDINGASGESDTSQSADESADVSAGVKGSRNPSRKDAPGTPGERGVVTAVSTASPYPVPLTKNTPASASPTLALVPEPTVVPSADPTRRWTDRQIDADPHFCAFWDAYPRKTDKGHARKAWLKALRERKATPEDITAGAAAYANDRRRDPNFTAHAATWLNGERWTDQTERRNAAASRPHERPWEN